jgi:hypothetical protein
MYKRKAQVVFLDRNGQAAATAARLANELGADWLEARAAALEPQTAETGSTAALGEPDKQWADLIVHFDAATGEAARPLPATTRLKLWPLEADPDTPGDALTEELRRRVRGMIGGMCMLSRLSPDDDD